MDFNKQNLFDIWNEKKQKLDANKRSLLFKEGEVWWCSLGINVGEEVYGKGKEFTRPVIILKKLSSNTCIILPLTTKKRKGTWYFFLNVQKQDQWVMMNQIRSISANRLIKREDSLQNEVFIKLKKSVAQLLGLFR